MGEECFAKIRAWQGQKLTPIAPMLGQNEDYDNFVFAWAPYLWALVAALMRDVDGAQVWILAEMARILGPEDQPYPIELGGLAAVWMLHVARSAGDIETYALAQDYLNAHGGINPAMLASPPMRGGELADLDEWGEELRVAAQSIPPVEQLPQASATASPDWSCFALRWPSCCSTALETALQRCSGDSEPKAGEAQPEGHRPAAAVLRSTSAPGHERRRARREERRW